MEVTLATYARQPGGVWRHVVDLATGLQAHGVGVSVAIPDDADDLRARAGERRLAVVGLTDRSADVWHVHLHDTFDRAALRALLRRVGHRQATVVTEHLPRTDASDPTLLPGGRTPGAAVAKRAFKRLGLRVADATIAVSEAARAFMVARYGGAARDVVAIPNGIPIPAAVPPPPAAGPMVVVAVGALVMQKGMDVLIDAAVGAHGWRARIVGTGPHLQRLRDRAAALDAPVELVGWSEDPLGEVAAADVLCLPSRWESFGYVVLEAMALGRPVVGSDVDAVGELVVDGVTGRLVAPEDPAALRAALDELARAPERRAELGAAAAARAREERFGLDAMVVRTLAVYEQVLRDGR